MGAKIPDLWRQSKGQGAGKGRNGRTLLPVSAGRSLSLPLYAPVGRFPCPEHSLSYKLGEPAVSARMGASGAEQESKARGVPLATGAPSGSQSHAPSGVVASPLLRSHFCQWRILGKKWPDSRRGVLLEKESEHRRHREPPIRWEPRGRAFAAGTWWEL